MKKHLLTLSLCSMAMTVWTLPSYAQQSPAPEHRMPTDTGSAAETGITGNDGSEPGSTGADSRSDDTHTREDHERKPKHAPVGDREDFSGNEGDDQSTAGSTASPSPGTGHGSTGQESGSITDGTDNSGSAQ